MNEALRSSSVFGPPGTMRLLSLRSTILVPKLILLNNYTGRCVPGREICECPRLLFQLSLSLCRGSLSSPSAVVL